MADVAEDVLEIIAKKIPGESRAVTPGDKLEELGLESVDFLEMVFDLEEKFAQDGLVVFLMAMTDQDPTYMRAMQL